MYNHFKTLSLLKSTVIFIMFPSASSNILFDMSSFFFFNLWILMWSTMSLSFNDDPWKDFKKLIDWAHSTCQSSIFSFNISLLNSTSNLKALGILCWAVLSFQVSAAVFRNFHQKMHSSVYCNKMKVFMLQTSLFDHASPSSWTVHPVLLYISKFSVFKV